MTIGRRARRGQPSTEEGRILARPARVPPSRGAVPLGLQRLGLRPERDALLYVPAGYRADRPSGLVLMLHGAGGTARNGIAPLLDFADAAGFILLAPSSTGSTWDVLRGGFGPDVAFIDRVLAQMFSRYAVDPSHVGIEGFSDGASYALSLGLTNGDLFSDIIAFSPGFMAPGVEHGTPRIFVSHGVHDQVLPIDRCSRKLVPMLKGAGYDVTYHEFNGGHTIPPEIARDAVDWFVAPEVEHGLGHASLGAMGDAGEGRTA